MFHFITALTTGGSVSLDSQSPAAPCESSSLATARDVRVLQRTRKAGVY